jgi:hypothetical protein
MLGFKSLESAAIKIAGIELLRGISKGHFAVGRLWLRSESLITNAQIDQ